jgi:hypothetical protein
MRTERGPVMVPFSRQNVSLTPKAMRVQKLITEGKSFDEAFAIADREYTSDGMSLKPGQQILPVDSAIQSAAGTTVIKHGQEARAI